MGHFHTLRPVIKDCVPTDDLVFLLLLNDSSPDNAHHFHGIDGYGDTDGKDVEYHLFRLGTGIDWDVHEFYTLHGWDPETGVPTRHRLNQLGLGYVWDALQG